jgi:hypothetical protein
MIGSMMTAITEWEIGSRPQRRRPDVKGAWRHRVFGFL